VVHKQKYTFSFIIGLIQASQSFINETLNTQKFKTLILLTFDLKYNING